MTIIKTIFRTLLLASFSIWFGGFGFYAAVVVPVGTKVLGSARQQGLITQQVTHQLNVVCGIAVAMMLIESVSGWKQLRRPSRAWQAAMVVVILASLIVLCILHQIMDPLIEPSSQTIADEDQFYLLHRIYLWTSTVQWVAGWIWIVLLVYVWPACKQLDS